MRGYNSEHIIILPDNLYAFAWSAPMRDLAAKVGRSDVGLRKLLQGYGVPIPPQGHWNKVHAGKPVGKRPKAPPRRPGEHPHWAIGAEFEGLVELAPELDPDGPFASPNVPQDIEELRMLELKAIARVSVPRDLSAPHPGLVELLKKEERRRAKKAAATTPFDWAPGPDFDGPMNLRRLRLLNGLFLTLAKRGHGGNVRGSGGAGRGSDDHLDITVRIGSARLGITLDDAGRRRQYRHSRREEAALPATTPLILTLGSRYDGTSLASWSDSAETRLESRLAEIAAAIIVEGERAFRRSVREDLERREAELRRLDEERAKRVAAAHAKRVEALKRSGDLLREAECMQHTNWTSSAA